MNLTFYQYMMRFCDRTGADRISQLANIMAKDMTFPKFENDFSILSTYLEENSQYSTYLSVFDQAWQKYQD